VNLYPTNVLQASIPPLVAADTAFLAAVTAMHVHLVLDAISPGLDTDFLTLTEPTFTGGAAKNAGTGAQTTFFDPLTGQRVIQLLEPAGGWSWICTVAPASAETVNAVVVTDTADTVTLGSQVLDDPVTITNIGDAITVGTLQLRLNVNAFID